MRLIEGIFYTEEGFRISIFKTESEWSTQINQGSKKSKLIEKKDFKTYDEAYSYIKRKYLIRNRGWSKEEEEWLSKNYSILPVEKIAHELGRTVDAIRNRAYKLNLAKGKTEYKIYQKNKFIAKGTIEELAKELFVSEHTIRNYIYGNKKNGLHGMKINRFI